MRRCVGGETAGTVKTRFMHGPMRRRSDRHKREGECCNTRGDLMLCLELATSGGAAMGHQKSAEAIVGGNAEGPNMKCRE